MEKMWIFAFCPESVFPFAVNLTTMHVHKAQVVENLLRGQSAALPLAQNLNVPRVRLGFSLACALHLGLLMTFFNNLLLG